MDETKVMLSMPNSVKVLVSKYDKRDYRSARVKRTFVTAIKCINSDIPFAFFKAAYRDQINRLDPARKIAFTLKNIKTGFAASNLFPFNPNRVLKNMPAPPAEPAILSADENLSKHLQKCTKAFQKSSTETILQKNRIRFLTTINNKAKVRRSTKSLVLGKAKIMSYEDLVEARAKRVVKEATRATKGKEKRGRKRKSSTLEAEENTEETARCSRKRKSTAQDPLESSNKVARAPVTASVVQMSGISIAENEIVPELWRAPVARMY
ncbi:hypothetical protein BDZ45DRAFT_708116 [Acephala macrosclerotiorum]|nr:hypothetical protein BDZ45DRAFT_708116 [Acephala macrosclerotiorum]